MAVARDHLGGNRLGDEAEVLAREPLELEGGTIFTFVTGGIEPALEQARRAAGGKDLSLAGGANAAQQFLTAGLVDEMEVSVVPTLHGRGERRTDVLLPAQLDRDELLGRGERLFDGVGDLHGLELVRTVAAPNVTHLKFARR